jgi:hypothetical protein
MVSSPSSALPPRISGSRSSRARSRLRGLPPRCGTRSRAGPAEANHARHRHGLRRRGLRQRATLDERDASRSAELPTAGSSATDGPRHTMLATLEANASASGSRKPSAESRRPTAGANQGPQPGTRRMSLQLRGCRLQNWRSSRSFWRPHERSGELSSDRRLADHRGWPLESGSP